MYAVNVTVRGICPLLQHKYPMPDYASLSKGGKKSTGAKDYSEEWRDYVYVNSAGQVFQPSSHFEGAMVKAAGGFKIQGKRGKSYKDLFQGNVFVDPIEILYGYELPDELDLDADKFMYIDMRPAVIQRNRIARCRPAIKTGWELSFTVNVIDDEIPLEIVHDVLELAGRTTGIGDYRPKFGRFMVTRFEQVK